MGHCVRVVDLAVRRIRCTAMTGQSNALLFPGVVVFPGDVTAEERIKGCAVCLL